MEEQQLELDDHTFHARSRVHPAAPVGGGRRTCVVFHHGGGFTCHSWSTVCDQLLSDCPDLDLISFDCRLHGQTHSNADEQVDGDDDMSLDALAYDLWAVVDALKMDGVTYEYVLVGHSMGGPVVVRAASMRSIMGVVVVDVVEGTALEALSHMQRILRDRPSRFDSVDAACEYAVRSGVLKSVEAARVSVPSQLVEIEGGFEWRADLAKTQRWWTEWFSGLSEKFLAVKGAKLLILANTDRLDKPLTIAQIQGKFQMMILHNVGHAVHEDSPREFASRLKQFIDRNSSAAVEKILRLKRPAA